MLHRAAPMLALAAALFGAGCVGSHDSSIVTFRDPHDVAVVGREADGSPTQWIGEREQKAVLVDTFQALYTTDEYETLSRQANGAVAFTSSNPYRVGIDLVLVDADGLMERQDGSPEHFVNDESRARARVFVPFVVRFASSKKVRGWVTSHWSNVAEVRKRSGADPRRAGGTFGGVASLVLGTALAGVGTWLAVDSAHRAHTGTTVLGGGIGAAGVAWDAWTLYQLFGSSHDEVIYSAPPTTSSTSAAPLR